MDSNKASRVHVGVGIDTARFGHHVTFLGEDRQDVAKGFTFLESPDGYAALETTLRRVFQQYAGAVHFDVRIDAAGQYATNLETFLRTMDLPTTISVGEPKRNKDYKNAHYPKRKADTVDSRAQARFAVVERPPASAAVSPALRTLAEVASRLSSQRKQTTRFINQLHNLLARVFPELATLVTNIAAHWVLEMLRKYPSAKKIAAARALSSIPYAQKDLLEELQSAAGTTVGSLNGAVAEALVEQSVDNVRQSQHFEKNLERLLEQAYDELGDGAHRQLLTIPGIGRRTAAALVAKTLSIDRFATPEKLVSYFGVFPEENTSGVDKYGNPVPPGTMRMSLKGNDLVRGYLWMACESGIQHNPALRALYRRQRAMGKRGDVALGHCMQKMLHLVFALWKTNQPFDPEHYPWEGKPLAPPEELSSSPLAMQPVPFDTRLPDAHLQAEMPATNELATRCSLCPPKAPAISVHSETATHEQPVTRSHLEHTETRQTKAAGRKEALPPYRKAVTAATNELAARSLPPPTDARNLPTSTDPLAGTESHVWVDFAHVRSQISIEAILSKLGALSQMQGRGAQRRGPCPIHGGEASTSRSFSVHFGKNVFRCLNPACGKQGNALDLWAAAKHLTLREAAIDLAEVFHLDLAPQAQLLTQPR